MIEIGNAQIVGKRDNQEDYFASLPLNNGILCVVADGMGGYEGGEVASQISVKRFLHYFKQDFNNISLINVFKKSLEYVHQSIKTEIKNNPSLESMGATIISAYIKENGIAWLNVGDSPMYRFRDNMLERINANHSVAGDLEIELKNHQITQKDFDENPNKHMLTSAITSDDIPIVELQDKFIEVLMDDVYILASDGIHSIKDREIEKILHLALLDEDISSQDIAENLINAVEIKNEANQDNTTVIIAKISDKVKNNNIKKKSNSKIKFFIGFIVVAILVSTGIFYKKEITAIVLDKMVKQDMNETKDVDKTTKVKNEQK